MSIFVIGVNHKTAPVGIREKIYFAEDKLALYLQDLITRGIAKEAVLLSTCNRSELYCVTEDIAAVQTWFCQQTVLTPEELQSILYLHYHEAAVAHIMRVACGLDSMILGEPQILGQMKDAFSESCTASVVGALFHRLFQEVFTVAKEIRTTTAIGACPVSVASAAIQFARQELKALAQKKIVLIGAGETSQLLVRYLKPHVTLPIHVVNRNVDQAFAFEHEVLLSPLSELNRVLQTAHVVFSATGSPVPILQQAVLSEVMRERVQEPLLLIDIAVPRDIDPACAALPNVHLHCIDDLKIIIEHNRQGREHAADKAKEMIQAKSKAFMQDLQSFDKVAHTICAYRGQVESMCNTELLKAKQQLQKGLEPHAVLEAFAHAFVNKLLHAPSVQLRQAGVEGRFEMLQFAQELFAIPDP